MGAARSAPTLLPRCLSLLMLLLLRMGMLYGFVVPPHPSGGIPSIATSTIIRPPPAAATSYTVEAAAPGAENEAMSCTTASVAETAADASSKAQTQTASSVGAAVASPDPFSTPSEFQEFLGRRKSGSCRVVLDLRPRADFRREHLEGSTSIPVDELEPRLLELPPPFAQPVNIAGSRQVCTLCLSFVSFGGSVTVCIVKIPTRLTNTSYRCMPMMLKAGRAMPVVFSVIRPQQLHQ